MPRKSLSTAGPGADEDPKSAASTKARDSIGVEDLNLPRTIIARLAKGVLPPNTQINKDSLLALSKSATVFVNFIAASASESAAQASRKTILPTHVLAALKENGFDDFVPRVDAEVHKNTELAAGKKSLYKQRLAENKKKDHDSFIGGGVVVDPSGVSDDERPAKKPRRDTADETRAEGSADEDQVEDQVDDDEHENPEDDEDENESEETEGQEDEDDQEEDEGASDAEDQNASEEDADRIDGTMIEDEALDDDRDDSD